MDLQLAGTKALVMGSTKGIGRAISETFLAERAFVAVRAYTASDVDAAVVELEPQANGGGGKVVGAAVDVAAADSLPAFGPILIDGRDWDGVSQSRQEFFEATEKSHPMGKMGVAQDVADVVAFLASLRAGHGSPRAGHVNRVNVTVDGGFLKRVDYR